MDGKGYISFALGKRPLASGNSRTQRLPAVPLSELGLIGAYSNGIGYGNISRRYGMRRAIHHLGGDGQFPELTAEHYALVTKVKRPKTGCGAKVLPPLRIDEPCRLSGMPWVNGVIRPFIIWVCGKRCCKMHPLPAKRPTARRRWYFHHSTDAGNEAPKRAEILDHGRA